MGTWYLIEALRPPALSIVFEGGVERAWKSVRSLTRTDGLDTIEEMLAIVCDDRVGFDDVVRGRLGDRRVVMRPVFGWEGEVYGIKTWIGKPDEEVLPERAVAAVNWDVESLVARHTLESYLMSSVDEKGFGDTRDPGEFLRKVVQFDSLNELTELCLNDGTRTHFQGALTVLHDDGHLMAWRGLARSGVGPGGSEVRGLFHDVTDTEEVRIAPLTALSLGDLSEDSSDSTPAVLVAYRANSDTEIPTPVLLYWVSRRPSYIAESAVHGGDGGGEKAVLGNLIHPEYWPDFSRARKLLRAGQDAMEIPFTCRLLGADGGWVKVRFILRRYPGAVGELLHIGRFRRIPESRTMTEPK